MDTILYLTPVKIYPGLNTKKKKIQERNFRNQSVIIYKHPADYLYSHYKRNHLMSLQRHKWYRYYDNFIKYFQPIIISYSWQAKPIFS